MFGDNSSVNGDANSSSGNDSSISDDDSSITVMTVALMGMTLASMVITVASSGHDCYINDDSSNSSEEAEVELGEWRVSAVFPGMQGS